MSESDSCSGGPRPLGSWGIDFTLAASGLGRRDYYQRVATWTNLHGSRGLPHPSRSLRSYTSMMPPSRLSGSSIEHNMAERRAVAG
ncbi:hypothetical protein HBI56_201130 [Parastagonospora nodorum]|uniref:Uncharacterized protein n=1 Tax=Phaeosphaeria nodorum (strain SN15 / ATCC MYA-4574 / FGSC 10173) TaxID=321614 RepID=A0A7U2EVW8_PHANO|nr:hypothetical protein HBH56_215680 [Parastagonospora nodorum]QRC93872.1 hypothetical protein JI435_404680 [Parastagonospora nodorum SN15]KAH3922597.1 hypothetical protein HBH54_221830 [Parastagonospora nodorum]KAH3963129.1 hypothetical protein HBH52_219670 [Parastagonospora nodorum]KAH4018782.1 hypothetical protein HBI09_189560 [Parastagonospora nodorum]